MAYSCEYHDDISDYAGQHRRQAFVESSLGCVRYRRVNHSADI